jgi:ectoine hydroxylase-related dioxygenase (phytanoyl-CoA dioxygenase family)
MTSTALDQGFSIFDDILSPQECNSLAAGIGTVSNGVAGIRNLMSRPAVSSLANQPRMLSLANQILGEQALPFRATLFDKHAGSNWHVLWHQDRALPMSNRIEADGWGPWSTKAGIAYALAPAWALEHVVALRVHLDEATDRNGPLRVIPGSHKAGVMLPAQISGTVDSGSAVTCLVGRGGVMAMRPLLLHSSSKASDHRKRRVLHIDYADRFDFGGGLQLFVA